MKKWRLLKNYQNYLISEYGEVMNRCTGKIIKPIINKKGYERIDLSYDKGLLIHRLVYETFVGELNHDLVIDHIDGNKRNNHYSNLQQITTGENTRKGKNCKHIVLKDNINNRIVTFNTVNEMFRYVGYSHYFCLSTIKKSKKFRNKEYEIIEVRLGGDSSHA